MCGLYLSSPWFWSGFPFPTPLVLLLRSPASPTLLNPVLNDHSPSPWPIRVIYHSKWNFPDGSAIKNPLAMQESWETWVWSLSWEDHLEKEMETHSSILAWRIPWTEEPGRLQSMGLQSQTLLTSWAHKYMQSLGTKLTSSTMRAGGQLKLPGRAAFACS